RAAAYLASLPEPARPDLTPLLAHWRKRRRRARARLQRRLAKRSHLAWQRALVHSIERLQHSADGKPAPLVRQVLPDWLRDGYCAVLGHADAVQARDLEGLHRLRIDCK